MTTGEMTINTDMGEGKSEIIDAVSMADYLELKRRLEIADEALEIAIEHMQKAVDEVEGCPFENCIQHDDGSTSCKNEYCIHYKASEIITEALSTIRGE